MLQRRFLASGLCRLGFGCVWGLAALAVTASAADWPAWRGPDGNSVSTETRLPESWDPEGGEGSNLLWKREYLAGSSTPVVVGGRLYTLARDQPESELEGEKVFCADATSGEKLWEHRFNVSLSDAPAARVGRSSVVVDPPTGRVYAQGVSGYFCCLDGASGSVVWERRLHEEFGLLSPEGGRAGLPLLYDDTVITSGVVVGWGDSPKWNQLATPAHRLLAFDKATGELRWLSGTRLIPHGATSGAPVLTEFDGQKALVFGSADGAVWAMQPGTGKPLWKCQLARGGLNGSPAIGPDGTVFMGHSGPSHTGDERGALVAVRGTLTGDKKPVDKTDKELWKTPRLMVGESSPVYYDGVVYAVTDTAELLALNPQTGETLARKTLGSAMRGSPLVADGKIYAGSHDGRWHVIRPEREGGDFVLKTVHEVSLPGEKVDASPIVANGRIYLTTDSAMYCLGAPDSGAAEPVADEAEEPADLTDKRVAQVQIVPWDVLLSPGQEQPYRLRLYNEAGEFLREARPEKTSFGVSGCGVINEKGVYRAPDSKAHKTAQVLCEFNGLKAKGRVRIVPPLPWSFDFEDGAEEVPPTWIGGRVRYALREDDKGNHYLAKPTELPTRPGEPSTKRGVRSRMWMGSPDLAGYTIRADIQLQAGDADKPPGGGDSESGQAAENPRELPTAGLINSGYTLALVGASQEARLSSWSPHEKRTQDAKAMKLTAGVWYRMKLVVVPKRADGVAIVQAKVWPRGDAEPGEWTLRLEDKAPNLSGSPGLFGDATEAEFYVDNLMVTPN